MLRNIPRNAKIAGLVVVVLLIIGALVYGIYTRVTRSGKVAVAVAVTPRDADISIDDVKVSPGTIYLVPNKKYTVKVHKDGFEDVAKTQYISSEEDDILVNLLAVSDEAKEWAKNHQDQYLQVEAQGGEAADKEGRAFEDTNPIVNALPYDNLIYSIGYRADTSDPSGNSIIISIEAGEGARNAAVQQIRDLGYDPTKYKIEFNDYKNPFAL